MSWGEQMYRSCDLAIRFTLWAESCRDCPGWERVVARYGISRPQAFRLIAKYRDAKGLLPLREAKRLSRQGVAA